MAHITTGAGVVAITDIMVVLAGDLALALVARTVRALAAGRASALGVAGITLPLLDTLEVAMVVVIVLRFTGAQSMGATPDMVMVRAEVTDSQDSRCTSEMVAGNASKKTEPWAKHLCDLQVAEKPIRSLFAQVMFKNASDCLT